MRLHGLKIKNIVRVFTGCLFLLSSVCDNIFIFTGMQHASLIGILMENSSGIKYMFLPFAVFDAVLGCMFLAKGKAVDRAIIISLFYTGYPVILSFPFSPFILMFVLYLARTKYEHTVFDMLREHSFFDDVSEE